MSEFVKGKCPLCGSGVFVASENWLTCSGATCPDPTFVSEIFAKVANLRAQLAQRDGELETLRAVVEEARGLHKMAQIPLLGVDCWRETCNHDDGDGCLEAATPTNVCEWCWAVWDDDRDREEPLPDEVRWPCKTIAILDRGLKGGGE